MTVESRPSAVSRSRSAACCWKRPMALVIASKVPASDADVLVVPDARQRARRLRRERAGAGHLAHRRRQRRERPRDGAGDGVARDAGGQRGQQRDDRERDAHAAQRGVGLVGRMQHHEARLAAAGRRLSPAWAGAHTGARRSGVGRSAGCRRRRSSTGASAGAAAGPMEDARTRRSHREGEFAAGRRPQVARLPVVEQHADAEQAELFHRIEADHDRAR